MKNFAQTFHCKSRIHCAACRNNDQFYQSLIEVFGKFKCPLDLPRPCNNFPIPQKIEKVTCVYQKAEVCCGKPVLCSHESMPDQVEAPLCGKDLCPYFEEGIRR